MKSVYAKDIKAITKMFNLSEDENWFLKNLSDSINSEKSEICMDIQEILLYGTSIDEKANAVKALLVYFGAKVQKENDLRNHFDQTTCKPFKTRLTVPLMSGKKITNTLLNLYLFLIIRFATIMLRMAQMKKMIKLIFTINFGMKPTTTH
jgi:hypothetical protein